MSHITVFHNGMTQPTSESVELDGSIVEYMVEPDMRVGSLLIWRCGHLRIIVSNDVLTSAP